MKTHTFFNKIILRTPLKKTATNITWEKIQSIFQESLYREALFVASPSLYETLKQYENTLLNFKKEDLASLKISLYKYYARFSNRCTPFGLFALVSTLGLAKETAINITTNTIRKATKFDTFFLANLLQVIDKEPAIRQQLTYYINSSLYSVSDKYRYVEYYFKEEVRLHKIAGVDKNAYLEKIVALAAKGTTLEHIATTLANEQVDKTQLLDFLHTLIDNQFLVSELELTVSGRDYLEQLIHTLSEPRFNSYEVQTVVTLLQSIQTQLKAIEVNNTGTVQPYLDLFEQINQQFDAIPKNKLFQIDTYRDLGDATLSHTILKELRTAAQVINKLSGESTQSNLDNFKQRFAERYEEYEMPLVQVLDPDIGIGYARELGAKTPLVEGLSISRKQAKTAQIDWDKKQSLLIRKLLNCYQNGAKEIVLSTSH